MAEEKTEKKDEASGKLPEGWTALLAAIPEMIYDVLARILPGFCLLAALSVYEPELQSAAPATTRLFGSALALVALSYMTGLVLEAFSETLSVPVWTIARILARRNNVPIGIEQASESLVDFVTRTQGRLYAVSASNPEDGRLLIKVMAERATIQNLTAGTVVYVAMLILFTPQKLPPFEHPTRVFVACMIAFCLLFITTTYRVIVYLSRLDHFFREMEKRKRDETASGSPAPDGATIQAALPTARAPVPG